MMEHGSRISDSADRITANRFFLRVYPRFLSAAEILFAREASRAESLRIIVSLSVRHIEMYQSNPWPTRDSETRVSDSLENYE